MSTEQRNTSHAMNDFPAGSTRWVVIPTAQRGRRHEVRLNPVFQVAKDVVEDATWYPLGLEAVRAEILDRLCNEPSYLPDRDVISLDFLSDLRSSLQHPDYLRRPWAYNKFEDEPSSSSSDDSHETPSDTERQGQNEDASGHDESPSPEEDASASQASEVSDRNFKFLQATWEFLKLQFKLFKLQSAPRTRRKGNKGAGRKRSKVTQREPTTPNTELLLERQTPSPKTQARQQRDPETRHADPSPAHRASPGKDDLDSLFESEED